MDIIQLQKPLGKTDGVAIALGYFDGLHRGHQAIIENVVAHAKKHHLTSAVLTFSTNPKLFLKKIEDTGLLTPMQEKIEILARWGVNQLLVLPFDERMAQMEPQEFINSYLLARNVRYVATGPDFCFGHRGSGNIDLLKQYKEHFQLNVAPKMEYQQEKIGATQIKDFLAKGEVGIAGEMLGRSYGVSGMVIKGNQKGRTIGFPTANIKVSPDYFLPHPGVYGVEVSLRGHHYFGMCNIGHNPTFNFTGRLSVEVNLFDFDEDIYGQTLRLEFIKYLRSERKFSSVEDLVGQLERDRFQARLLFEGPRLGVLEEVQA